MVDTIFSYVEEVEPRMLYVDPLVYKFIEEQIEGYVREILKSSPDEEFDRLGTFEENMQMAYQENIEESTKKKVESIMGKAKLTQSKRRSTHSTQEGAGQIGKNYENHLT